MNDDVFMLWLPYRSTIWAALLAGLAPATIAKFKRRSPIRWYLYGFTCTLVAWPLIALATIHALLVRSQIVSPVSPEVRQRQRRLDALALLAESSVQSYPSWIAELRRKSPDGTDRRRYAYENIGPGESSNSSANLPIRAPITPWRFATTASTLATSQSDIVGSHLL